MRLFILFIIIINFNFYANAQGIQPKSIIDEELFQNIRERYNGEWDEGDAEGIIRFEVLKNGPILIEIVDRLAEFIFYNIPKANEDKLYISFVNSSHSRSGYLNYFNRIGSSIRCGFWSYDLKKNPFPSFKCRFSIDKEGKINPFMDRSIETSNEKLSVGSKWEIDQKDFHWRSLSKVSGNAIAASRYELRRDSQNKISCSLRLNGEIAKELFNLLKVTPTKEIVGGGRFSREIIVKKINNIHCNQDSCQIFIAKDGSTLIGK